MTEPTRSVQRRIAAQKGLPAPDFSEPAQFNNSLEADAHNWDERELADKKLREQIAQLIDRKMRDKESTQKQTITELIALIKQVGYLSPEEHQKQLEEAKEQGREIGKREMIDWSDDFCIIHGDADERIRTGKLLRQGNCYECWRALKSREGV